MKTNLKAVMKAAWEMARAAVVNFGGKAREFLAASLKMAWAGVKKGELKVLDYSMFDSCENRTEIIEDLEKGSCSSLWHEIGKSNGASNRRPSGITAKVKKELVLDFFAKNPQHEGAANAAISNKRMKALKELEAMQDGICDFKWWVGGKESRIYANVTAHGHALRFASAYFDQNEKKFFGEEEVARMLEAAMKKVGLI